VRVIGRPTEREQESTMSTTLNAPQHIINVLEEGIQATRMKSAGLLPPGRAFSAAAAESDAYTAEVREQTRIYRETWVETPLLVVLAYLKGDIDARKAKDLWFSADRKLDGDIRDPRIALGLDFTYKATHQSVQDGSPAMLVSESDHLGRDDRITLVNEDGHLWTDPSSKWEKI
jgi:hypothetical protein